MSVNLYTSYMRKKIIYLLPTGKYFSLYTLKWTKFYIFEIIWITPMKKETRCYDLLSIALFCKRSEVQGTQWDSNFLPTYLRD